MAPRRTPLVVAMGAKELLQIMMGAGDIRAMITVKHARPIAPGDLLEVGQHGGERQGHCGGGIAPWTPAARR